MDALFDALTANQWTVVGVLATVGSTLVAAIQGVRFGNVQRNFNTFRSSNNHRTWGDIQLILELYETLDEARTHALDPSKLPSDTSPTAYLASKLSSARRSAIAAYLRLLEQAIDDEDEFTEETAKEWLRLGKLENDWRYQKSLKFVSVKSRTHARTKTKRVPSA